MLLHAKETDYLLHAKEMKDYHLSPYSRFVSPAELGEIQHRLLQELAVRRCGEVPNLPFPGGAVVKYLADLAVLKFDHWLATFEHVDKILVRMLCRAPCKG